MSELVKYTGGPVKIHTLDAVPGDRRRLLFGTVVSRPITRYNLPVSENRRWDGMATLSIVLGMLGMLGAPFALLLLVLFFQVVPR